MTTYTGSVSGLSGWSMARMTCQSPTTIPTVGVKLASQFISKATISMYEIMKIGAVIIWQFIGIDWSIQMCRYYFFHDTSKNPEKNQKCFAMLPGQPKEKSSVTALYRNKERFLPGPETSAIISAKLQWVKQLKTSSVVFTKNVF